MTRVTVAQADDWGGVYLDGQLIYEGHSTPTPVWLQILERLGAEVVNQAETELAYEVIEREGSCPTDDEWARQICD